MICKGLLSIEWDLKWCESVHGKIYNILIENDVTNIIIDWTGLLDFYRKLGFEVFKSYYYMSKTL